MIRAVIFDFNGVLVDDEAIHCRFLREILAEEGIAVSEAQYHAEYLGYDDRGCFEVALSRHGQVASPDRVAELIARKSARYDAWARESLESFPGAREAVRALAERWPLAICSGALRGEIEAALAGLGLDESFEAIIAAEDTERCKPDPEGYFLALDALRSTGNDGLEAAHCLVIEDSLAGVAAAKAAGMWTIAVLHSYTEDELRHAGADAILHNLADLNPEWVRRLFLPEVSP
jgi:HAD superfamily hydrolase (TIGR01509 family)